VLLSFHTTAQTNLINYLPAKAGMIIDIDGSSLSQKLSWNELKEMKFFDSLLKKAEPVTRKMIAEPSETGINFHDHLYFVFNFNGAGDNSENYFSLYGKIEEENKLSQLLATSEDKKIVHKTSGENKMLIGKDFLFGWNKSVFVLYTGAPFSKKNIIQAKQKESEKKKENERKKEVTLLEKKCVELLTPHDKNIFSNKYFEEMAQRSGDIRIWVENDLLKNNLNKGPLAAFKMNNFKGEYKTVNINFEKGKIISHAYTYYDDSTSAFMQKMYAKKLNGELLKKIPGGNLLGLFAVSFKPKDIKDFLERSGMMKEFKTIDKEDSFNPMSFLESLKGDVMIAVNMPEHPSENEDQNPFKNMQIFFAATVNDEKKVNRLIDSMKLVMEEKKRVKDSVHLDQDTLVVAKENNMFKNMKPAISVKDSLFILSFNEEHIAEFLTASNNKYDGLVKDYGDHPSILMFDLKTFMSIAMSSLKKQNNPNEDPEMYSFFEVFDKMIIASGKFENSAMLTTQEVKFTNSEENSLKQMMKMIDLVFSAITNSSKKIKVKEN
jgi:hypothetical protein